MSKPFEKKNTKTFFFFFILSFPQLYLLKFIANIKLFVTQSICLVVLSIFQSFYPRIQPLAAGFLFVYYCCLVVQYLCFSIIYSTSHSLTRTSFAFQSTDITTMITIDDVVSALRLSIFNPIVLIPLVFALPSARLFTWYTFIVTAVASIYWLDHYLRRAPFKLDPATDLVIITGAGSKNGIGRYMVEEFCRAGFSVLILALDMQWDAPANVTFLACDVTNREDLALAQMKISNIYSKLQPAVLINNAGVAHNKLLLDLPDQVITNVINVNLLAPFWTIKTFVPGMVKRGKGHIVNISSVLGTMGVSQLSAYCASKHGLIGFHDSLTHELTNPYNYYPDAVSEAPDAPSRPTGIATLLVVPGHISTEMFAGVRCPDRFLSPILNPKDVGRQIAQAVLQGETGRLYFPFYTRVSWIFSALPGIISEAIRLFSRADLLMSGFKGPGITEIEKLRRKPSK